MNKKVLIVDDEPDVVTYVTTVLRQHGFFTLSSASAPDGYELVCREEPAVICLDIMMPRESGISLYTRLKKNPRLRRIPVVIISGVVQSDDFDFREYVADRSVPPPDEYIEKPIQVDRFIEVIERLAGRGGPTDKNKSGHHATR